MSGGQAPQFAGTIRQLETILEKAENITKETSDFLVRFDSVQDRQEKSIGTLEQIRQTLVLPLQELSSTQSELLRKVDAISEAIDLLRQDVSVSQGKLRQDVSAAQDKLRAALLSKMDGLQGTMDLVRQDVRNSWNTADFAIINSRHTREETDKLLNLISTMQKQQQLLTSQVEELRRNAADKGLDGSPA